MGQATFIWSFVFGVIGLSYFMYGKNITSMSFRFTGLALMIFPYFIPNVIALVLVGFGLIGLPFLVKV